MKKIVFALLFLAATASDACCYRGPYFHGGPVGCCVSGWVAPALVGGVIGYELAKPNTVVVQPPVVVQQPVVTQLPPAPYGYHYQMMVNPQNNFQQWVLVPN
jgi:hypothetical protein